MRRYMTIIAIALMILASVGCGSRDAATSTSPSTSTTAVTGPSAVTSKAQTKPSGTPAMTLLRVINAQGQLSEPVELPTLNLTPEQWKERLTPEQFKILRSHGTEAPFCGGLLHNKEDGIYACAGCSLPLFETAAKFDSGTGWPSFFTPIAKENIIELMDRSYGMVRIEIRCARCDGHLGHVFNDGPRPTGLRYCLNSEALRFVPNALILTLAEQIPEPPMSGI